MAETTGSGPTGTKRFQEERAELNDRVMRYAGLTTKRFFGLDTRGEAVAITAVFSSK